MKWLFGSGWLMSTKKEIYMLSQIHYWTATIYAVCLLCMAIWIPFLRRLPPERCMGRFCRVLVIYHPFILILLGVILMTGAMLITDLKVRIGTQFFEVMFHSLGQKLLIFFLIALYSSHMFFGVGLKVTRANAPPELREFEMPMEDQLRTLRRIHTGTIVNLVLSIYAYSLGSTMV